MAAREPKAAQEIENWGNNMSEVEERGFKVDLNSQLIERVSGVSVRGFLKLTDLNLVSKKGEGTVQRIENLHLVPNLQSLNLSFNSIERIDGLRC